MYGHIHAESKTVKICSIALAKFFLMQTDREGFIHTNLNKKLANSKWTLRGRD